jgi:hypothetical protein
MTTITVFKTYRIETNKYDYWADELPNHNEYDFIVGQRVIQNYDEVCSIYTYSYLYEASLVEE